MAGKEKSLYEVWQGKVAVPLKKPPLKNQDTTGRNER